MFTRKRILIGLAVAVLIPVIAIGWWLISPVFIDKTVDEEFPLSFLADVPSDMNQQEVEDKMAEAAETDSTMEEEMPDAMVDDATVRVKVGSFADADSRHKGSGTATIFRGPDGSHLLRFEDFKVSNGPALVVLVSPHPNPQNRDEVKTQGYIEVGGLKGNIGNQNYILPPDLDISTIGSVIIYCKPFHVIFSVAPLADAG